MQLTAKSGVPPDTLWDTLLASENGQKAPPFKVLKASLKKTKTRLRATLLAEEAGALASMKLRSYLHARAEDVT